MSLRNLIFNIHFLSIKMQINKLSVFPNLGKKTSHRFACSSIIVTGLVFQYPSLPSTFYSIFPGIPFFRVLQLDETALPPRLLLCFQRKRSTSECKLPYVSSMLFIRSSQSGSFLSFGHLLTTFLNFIQAIHFFVHLLLKLHIQHMFPYLWFNEHPSSEFCIKLIRKLGRKIFKTRFFFMHDLKFANIYL